MTALKSDNALLLAAVATIAALVTGSSIYAATVQYEYDSLNRLVRVTYDEGPAIEYSYDALGNRTQKKVLSHSTHAADTNSDWVIGDPELLDYIDLWALGQVGDLEILDTIDLWAAGHYYWDEAAQEFKPGVQP